MLTHQTFGLPLIQPKNQTILLTLNRSNMEKETSALIEETLDKFYNQGVQHAIKIVKAHSMPDYPAVTTVLDSIIQSLQSRIKQPTQQ